MNKRLNMIIGKKQIILAGLTLILGIAIYLSFMFEQSGKDLSATKTLEDTSNYGESVFVASGAVSDANIAAAEYFEQFRLDRTKSRDEATETMQTLLQAGDLTTDELATAKQEAVSMAKLIESEGKIETLVKAQGFADCLVYLDGKSANIIVKTDDLTTAQAAQIKSILLGEVTVAAENITIVPVK